MSTAAAWRSMMAKSMTAINPDGHSNDVHNHDGHMEVYVAHKV